MSSFIIICIHSESDSYFPLQIDIPEYLIIKLWSPPRLVWQVKVFGQSDHHKLVCGGEMISYTSALKEMKFYN